MSFNKPFRAVPIREGAHYAARRRKRQKRRLATKLAAGTLLVAALGGGVFMTRDRHETPSQDRPAQKHGDGWSYPHCDAARAAGAAPLRAGEAGYGPHLDRDGDGIACEPYVGQR